MNLITNSLNTLYNVIVLLYIKSKNLLYNLRKQSKCYTSFQTGHNDERTSIDWEIGVKRLDENIIGK